LPWNAPLDARDLATRLETEGVTDAVAGVQFGYANTLAMAEAWLPKLPGADSRKATETSPVMGWREYWKGIVFALPLLISSASILLFGFGLWGGNGSIEETTAIGVGTIASFLLTGGFVQVIARRGLFLAATHQFRRCEHSTWWLVRVGAATMLGAVLLMLAASAYWGWMPARLNLLAAAFCLALGCFWMGTGILQYLGRGLEIAAITVGGIGLVAGLHAGFGVPTLLAQLTAVWASTAVAGIMAFLHLRGRREHSTQRFALVNVRETILLWPYFVYGLLYYLLLFSDRLVAWTADTYATSLVIQFRGDYESAVNLGLFTFIFEVGWVQYSVALFYQELASREKNVGIDSPSLLGRQMTEFYWRRIIRFVPLAVFISGLAIALETGPFSHLDRVAATWSVIGFPFLIVGLWNASLLFALSGAPKAAAAAGVATVIDILFGYVLSRLGAHQHAIIGFAAGAVTFAVLSGYWSLRTLRRVDHAYYAATQ
jgi:hypothetical protein